MFAGTLLPRATLDGRILPRNYRRMHEVGAGAGLILPGSVLIDPETGNTIIDPESGFDVTAPYPLTPVSLLRSIPGVVWFNPSEIDSLEVTSAPELSQNASSIIEPASGYPELDVSGTAFTMFGWIYVPSVLADDSIFLDESGMFSEPLLVGRIDGENQLDPHQFLISMSRNGAGFQFVAYDGTDLLDTAWAVGCSGDTPHHQKWHFIFFTVTSGGVMSLRVDGNAPGATPTGSFPSLPNARLVFPASHPWVNLAPEPQDTILPVRYAGWGFARQVLSGDDETELLNGGVPLNYSELSAPLRAKLTAFWSFESNQGGEWEDSAGSLTLEESTGSVPAQYGFGPYEVAPEPGGRVDAITSDSGGSDLGVAASEFRPTLGVDSGKYRLEFTETLIYAPGPPYGYGLKQKEMNLSPAITQDTTGSVFVVVEFSELLENETLVLCPGSADDLTFVIAAGVPNLVQEQDYFFGLISGPALTPGKYLIEVGWDGDKSWLRVNGDNYTEDSVPNGSFMGQWEKVGNSANQHDFYLYDLVICPGDVTEERRIATQDYLMTKHDL